MPLSLVVHSYTHWGLGYVRQIPRGASSDPSGNTCEITAPTSYDEVFAANVIGSSGL